jgi:hypothetical protein
MQQERDKEMKQLTFGEPNQCTIPRVLQEAEYVQGCRLTMKWHCKVSEFRTLRLALMPHNGTNAVNSSAGQRRLGQHAGDVPAADATDHAPKK